MARRGLRRYVGELSVTSVELTWFGHDLGYVGPPFRWNPERREVLSAELDAAFFQLYGFSRDEVVRVMDSFWIVRDNDVRDTGTYRTKGIVLTAYDAMGAATPDRPFVSRVDPPPGDPRVAHPPGPGEEPGRWISWSGVFDRPLPRQPEPRTRTARPRPSMAVGVRSSAIQSVRPAAVVRPPRDSSAQQKLVVASDPAHGDGQWRPETTVEPVDIVMGMRVRHRSYGAGSVLSVKASGKGAELLVRFDVGGEKWIVFGYGVLEFAGDEEATRGSA